MYKKRTGLNLLKGKSMFFEGFSSSSTVAPPEEKFDFLVTEGYSDAITTEDGLFIEIVKGTIEEEGQKIKKLLFEDGNKHFVTEDGIPFALEGVE